MIATLRGKVSHVGIETMVVEVGDVGYLVTAPGRLLAEVATIGADVYLHIHTYVREDQISLYGFKTLEDREFFELLHVGEGDWAQGSARDDLPVRRHLAQESRLPGG